MALSASEMIARVQSLTAHDDGTTESEDTVSYFLDRAAEIILRRRYPLYSDDELPTEVPTRYQHVQIDVAVYLIGKQGAEGETLHLENNVNRHYESAGVPDSMLRSIIPYLKVVSSDSE